MEHIKRDWLKSYIDNTIFLSSINLVNSKRESILYTDKIIASLNDIETDEFKRYDTKISVANKTTLGAIYDVKSDDKIAVLNFSSPTTPGGGWDKMAVAQEETLARNSDLMPYLLKFKEEYYDRNKFNPGINSNSVIYSKSVVFWSNEHGRSPDYLKTVDVITCSAPNRNKLNEIEGGYFELYEFYKKRIYNILRAAQINRVKILILGAWGCGVFGNNPVTIARIFKKTIEDYFNDVFQEIQFVIYDEDHKTPNLSIFKSVFS